MQAGRELLSKTYVEWRVSESSNVQRTPCSFPKMHASHQPVLFVDFMWSVLVWKITHAFDIKRKKNQKRQLLYLPGSQYIYSGVKTPYEFIQSVYLPGGQTFQWYPHARAEGSWTKSHAFMYVAQPCMHNVGLKVVCKTPWLCNAQKM